MNIFIKYTLVVAGLLGFSGSIYAVDTPYTLEGANCSLTVHDVGYDGDVHYSAFYAVVSVSAAPDVLFDVSATSPYSFIGQSDAVEDTLYIRARRSHWGPYPMNGAFYQLADSFCRTRVKKEPTSPKPPRPRP